MDRSSRKPGQPTQGARTTAEKEARQARLVAAMRANLKKRKAQQRSRAQVGPKRDGS